MKSLLVVIAVLIAAVQTSYFRRHLQKCPSTYNFVAESVTILDIILPASEPIYSVSTATDFFKNVMNFNETEIRQVTNDAINFFKIAYGVDFSNSPPDANGIRYSTEFNATFAPYGLNSALRYRTTFYKYIVNGARHSLCANSRDGGFVVNFGSDGLLHGTYGGKTGLPIRANEALVYGWYNIPLCVHSPLIVHFESASPLRVDTVDGFGNINSNLSSDELGPGLAQGVSRVRPLGDGTVHFNFRNMFTFPPHPGQRR